MTIDPQRTALPDGMPDSFAAFVPMLSGLAGAQLLRTALDLQLPDTISEQPVSVADLAEHVGATQHSLRRLLRALAELGLFRPVGEDHYAHSELSAALRADAEPSARPMLEFLTAPAMWRTWGQMTTAIRSGREVFTAAHGKPAFQYMAEDDPESGEVFNTAMTAILGRMNEPIVDQLDTTGLHTLVDVGGGQGTLLRDVLRRNENLSGVLYDLESAVAGADEGLRALGKRAQITAGSAFESVPEADGYLLRTVLHMFDDETCVRLLRSIAESAQPGARIFVVDMVLPEQPDNPLMAIMDLQMLAMTGGQERSETEFAELFRRTGLSYVRSTPTESLFHIIEARLDT